MQVTRRSSPNPDGVAVVENGAPLPLHQLTLLGAVEGRGHHDICSDSLTCYKPGCIFSALEVHTMVTARTRHHRIEPEHLGPLGERSLAESAKTRNPDDLFDGASTFLSARYQHRRREQWNAAMPLAERVLKPEEHVLYVAHGMQMPPVLHSLALGAMALPYHQVMLLFTESRLIEVLMSPRGKTAEHRLRSFPWACVRDLKLSLGKLALVPAGGKKQSWKVPLGGDRKLLKLLLPRLKPLLLLEGAQTAQRVPLWHCPQCGATVPANPQSCDSCRTSFRSTRLAALLSLAFPGAGLFYAGHPFLGTLDFLGEVLLYALFVLMMLENNPERLAAALGFGVIFFFLTKLESVHLSHILTARSTPETETRRTGYRRFAVAGGLASLLLIAGAFPLAAAARLVVDRDLDVSGENGAWRCSRNVEEWDFFSGNSSARSQWRHPSGLRVTLFAYPQGVLDSVDEFRTQFRASLLQQGVKLVKDAENVPLPCRSFRTVGLGRGEGGEQLSFIHYFVVDKENRDLHQALAIVTQESGDMAEELVSDLLSHAHWIAAVPPERPAHARRTAGGGPKIESDSP